jgi:SAM-dependent methyltransferase
MGEPAPLPAGIDPNRPSPARMYDYFLGGTHNFAADRVVADRAVELVPEVRLIARANRAFLGRAVRFAAGRGIRQFLDLGAGIPAADPVHAIARAVRPDARVAYVDREPTAVLHARAILGDDPGTVVLQADLQRGQELLADPALRAVLDLTEPVCVLMVAVLHFLPDGPELTEALRHYHDAVAPGSVLAVTHATAGSRCEQLERFTDLYHRTGTPLVMRDRSGLAALLEGWVPVAPGIVHGPEWHPEPGTAPVPDPASYATLAGVFLRT